MHKSGKVSHVGTAADRVGLGLQTRDVWRAVCPSSLEESDAPPPDVETDLTERLIRMADSDALTMEDAGAVRAALLHAREHHRSGSDLPSFF